MRKKLIAILLFIVPFFIFINCKIICNNIVEDKKVLVTGNVVEISGDIIESETHTKFINTNTKNIGIMTGINLNTNQYVAFGHKISLGSKLENSNCYEASCYSIEKSQESKIGKLNASNKSNQKIGNVIKNIEKGVFGEVTKTSEYSNLNSRELYVASKYEIKIGDAKLYINLDGNGIKEYNVKINNIDYFDNTHNIDLKVTDEELIEKTGGIVKGMSGTPIVQNGKLIGAINSSLESNPTKAYGIFADELF